MVKPCACMLIIASDWEYHCAKVSSSHQEVYVILMTVRQANLMNYSAHKSRIEG
mgnify:CR=1 FL=1